MLIRLLPSFSLTAKVTIFPVFPRWCGIHQTWEDPSHVNPELGYAGDNDPVDVVEIGGKVLQCGTVTPVRVVGTLAMIDEGEVDWKMIAINASHPAASGMNSLEDVEKAFPGELDAIREWFRTCECGDKGCGVPRPSSNYSSAFLYADKIPDGKPANEFGYDEKMLDEVSFLLTTTVLYSS